nr:MAG TPA: hypothetical protein [Caudoviricetes sp.]
MWYIKENGIISQCSEEKFCEEALYTEKEIVYDGNGILRFADEISDEEKADMRRKVLLNQIRADRENTCFPIINRGQLWYNKLTEAQKTELDAWYQAWLDAPQTLTEPSCPAWLDEERR